MQGKRLDPSDRNPSWSAARSAPKQGEPEKTALQLTIERERARRERRRKLLYRAAVAILAVLLALLIGVAVWWKVFTQRPVLPEELPTPPSEVTDIDPPIRTSGDRREDFFTFLILGRDTGGGGNTDTILLASYDIPSQQLNIMSIPRDTMVNVPWEIKRINSVYNYYGGGDKGVEALGKEVAQLVGFTPDFQMVLEWKAVGELVDALGGIRFDVPQNMYYRDPAQDLTINLKKGDQLMDGDKAMQLVRFRSYPDGDLGRIAVQQDFLKEVIRTCLKLENMTKVNALAKVFTDNVKTNLSINEIAWLSDKAIFGGLRTERVNFFTMPNSPASIWSKTYQNYQSYVVPEVDELVALVNTHFNPYLDELDTHELDILSVRGGKISSSTGKLEDPNANSYHPPAANEGRTERRTEPGNAGESTDSQPPPGTDEGQTPDQSGTPPDSGGEDPENPPSGETEEPPTPPPPETEGASNTSDPSLAQTARIGQEEAWQEAA